MKDAAQMASGVRRETVAVVNPLEDEQFDRQFAASGRASFFHGRAWARVLSETYGYRPFYFTLRGGATPIEPGLAGAGPSDGTRAGDGLLAVMEVDSWLTGRRGVSLPFTDHCEPLAADQASFQRLLDQAIACGRRRGWKYLELRGGAGFLAAAQPSQQFYVHELDLVPDEEELFAKFKSSVRRAVRKAEKQGLTVRIAQDLAGVEQFYALQCITRRKHGLPPQPFRFFENLHRRVLAEGGGAIALASIGSKAMAANFFIQNGSEVIYKFGASDPEFQELRASDLVMWEGIKHYAAKGYRSLHLGRSSLANEGLRRFKLGWGTREETISYFKYDLRLGGYLKSRDEAFGWYNRVFAAMPLGMSRCVGRLLYRHVA